MPLIITKTFIFILSIYAPQAYSQESLPAGCGNTPCKVVFGLDAQNNLILQEVEDHHRSEAVIRLTTKQAEKVAAGPTATDATSPPKIHNEFNTTLEELAKIPGLGFLAKKPQNTEKGNTTNTPKGRKATTNKNAYCTQIKAFTAALKEDATTTQAEHLTPAEIAQCTQTRHTTKK